MSNLFVTEDQRKNLLDKSIDFKSWTLSPRQINDLEMLITGAFHPLNGFMNEDDFYEVLDNMRLSTGELFPIPITLDVTQEFSSDLKISESICLRDPEGLTIAILEIQSIYNPDKNKEALNAFGTLDEMHPAVSYLNNNSNDVYIGGKVIGINQPRHFDFTSLRDTPDSLKAKFQDLGWNKIVAFQTRNPMHRAHFEILHQAANDVDANILIHPVVGLTKPGDVDHFIRTKCYKEIVKKFPNNSAALSLLPLAMRMAGPREALLHAIVRKNYGVTHLIVGRDHAGPGKDSNGNDIYGPYDAQELVAKHEDEIGIKMIPFRMQVYVKERSAYAAIEDVKDNETGLNISGTELRHMLKSGDDIPEWFTFPEVSSILQDSYPKSHKQGFTVFFTGLSGSGKSTIANGLMAKLLEETNRKVTILDGDLVRQHLSSELGFSKEHRDLNIQRISYVASEITKHSGIAICAPIAPYFQQRSNARRLIEPHGNFIEVYVNTTFEQCEERDVKGLYAKARQGIIKGFTGLDDPYEAPTNPEIVVSGASGDPLDEVAKIIHFLKKSNLL
jgi:sulfate adenylyltransferase